MNPVKRFKIENYKEVLKEIETVGSFDNIKDLEDRVISEIIELVNDGSDEAKAKLEKLEKLIEEKLDFTPKCQVLISALKNSIKGALSAARFTLF